MPRYTWLAIWYAFATFEMVYVKRVVDTLPMTTWSRTYYQVSGSQTLKHVMQPGKVSAVQLISIKPLCALMLHGQSSGCGISAWAAVF